MSFREKLALNISPIPLRVMLAATFMWAGLGKMMAEMPVQGQQAATLANLGHTGLQAHASGTPAPSPEPQTEPRPEEDPDEPISLGIMESNTSLVQSTGRTYSAQDFPDPVNVSRVYGLCLAMHAGASSEDGYWPIWAGQGDAVFVLAWVVTLAEAALGLFVLLGLLTRISALGLASIMIGAMWLTEMGPAVQAGSATFGFLPAHETWDTLGWAPFLWQLSLIAGSLTLFFAGPGSLSFDRLMFDPKPNRDDQDEYDEDYDE